MGIYKEYVDQVTRYEFLLLINARTDGGAMVENHWHDYYELLYIQSGACMQTIDGSDASLSPGDVAIIAPGSVHSTSALAGGCSIAVILFFPDMLRGGERLASGYLLSGYGCRAEIIRLFNRIDRENGEKQAGWRYILNGCISEFIGYLSRSGSFTENRPQNDPKAREILDWCRYIDENASRPLRLTEISAMAGYTPEYFSLLFKRVAGQTYKAYVVRSKMLAARRLMISDSLSVGEAADRVGYENLSSFCRAYRRVMGSAPSGAASHGKKRIS